MIRNVSIDKVMEVLTFMKMYVTHCDIEIDEKNKTVLFRPTDKEGNIGEVGTAATSQDPALNLDKPLLTSSKPKKPKSNEQFDGDRDLNELIP